MEPDEQHTQFIDRIEPIVDKLLFIRGGNHDMIRSVNILGFDVSKIMADMLEVPYFSRGGSFLRYADYARYSFYPMIRTGWITMEFNENKIRAWTN